MSDEFLAALTASGPDPRSAERLDLFGRFVGAWRLHWRRLGADAVEAEGELHFGWVLGGRAVQDVWIVPGPGRPGAGVPPYAFHGSTIRFYDPSIDAWRSTWVEPVNGRVRTFIGRATDEGIELLSDDATPALRWRFTEVRPDSFVWTGDYLDAGGNWVAEEIMTATRMSPASGSR